jgi:peptidoglycan/LPS O-acetylase OafA/YrhL
VGLAGCYLLAFTEYVVLKQYLDVYASTVFISILIFVFSLQHKYMKKLKALRWIGKNLSGTIYLLHLPCIVIIEQLGISGWGYIEPILATLCTITISAIVFFIESNVKENGGKVT